MEFEQLIRLINIVSDSKLKQFKYEEKGVKISMGKEILMETGNTSISSVEVPGEIKKEKEVLPADIGEGADVVSPLVGTFYEAAQEGGEPFVTVGSRVKKGQVLAIVEAMKLMNEIESERDGVITEICVKNGETVEYGQTLFKIAEGVR